MFQLARLVSCAALVAFALLVTCVLCPAVLTDLGLNLSGLPVWLRDLDREWARSEKLVRQFQDFRTANQTKRRLSKELIDGKRTLAEVARAFCDLSDRPEPAYRELLGNYYPADSSEESLCLHILDWTDKLLWEEPARHEEIRRRLEGEMREHLRATQGGG
jgi:hypothetical protein